jgi:rRNA maturation protein Nop10
MITYDIRCPHCGSADLTVIECAACLSDAFVADPQDDDRFIPLDAQGARRQRMKRELHITGGH